MPASAALPYGSAPVISSASSLPNFIRRYSVPPRPEKSSGAPIKRTCLCSPTNHPGSFRCSLHKGGAPGNISSGSKTASYGGPGRQNMMRRSAVKNAVVRIGTAEGNLVRRSLTALIRPSSHQQRRRHCGEFRCRPSRLSVMSMG